MSYDELVLTTWILKVCILFGVVGLVGESLDNYIAKKNKPKPTTMEQWAKQYKIDVPAVWKDK
jgi:hypothetical protein